MNKIMEVREKERETDKERNNQIPISNISCSGGTQGCRVFRCTRSRVWLFLHRHVLFLACYFTHFSIRFGSLFLVNNLSFLLLLLFGGEGNREMYEENIWVTQKEMGWEVELKREKEK
jgi:hypothetical protein